MANLPFNLPLMPNLSDDFVANQQPQQQPQPVVVNHTPQGGGHPLPPPAVPRQDGRYMMESRGDHPLPPQGPAVPRQDGRYVSTSPHPPDIMPRVTIGVAHKAFPLTIEDKQQKNKTDQMRQSFDVIDRLPYRHKLRQSKPRAIRGYTLAEVNAADALVKMRYM